MKTLNAKTLKAKKDNLRAKFESIKKEAKKYDDIAAEALKKRDEMLGELSSLQGAFKVVEDLEKELGLSGETTKRKRSNKNTK